MMSFFLSVVEAAKMPEVQIFVSALVVLVSAMVIILKESGGGATPTTGERTRKKIPVILGMATGNPPYKVSQKQALQIAEAAPECASIRPVLARIYGNSRIESRYMAIPDFTPGAAEEEKFFPGAEFKMPVEARLRKFKEKAVPLVTEVCLKALKKAGVLDVTSTIGKLVVVSSTGFLGPGLDCELIQTLGLKRSVDRSLIGFMGCAAAINGFRVANDFAVAHPGELALLCCVELSSVHTTFDDNVNDAILHAIFADGCAAAVIGALDDDDHDDSKNFKGKLAIVDTHAALMPGTDDGITLSINENGISCTLSKYLPQYIAKNMGSYVDGFLSKHGLAKADLDFWAIHPGGRRIIEEAQNGLGLSEDQAKYSWKVLAQYGNMLSPSVMFVLELILDDYQSGAIPRQTGNGKSNLGIAFSFSPGVGAEGILLKLL
mmetsp:Transcript_22290/g.71846  ORF Transcript_22290/g.71846 Transcript_22290/m.71846 type:complete len:434 (+) Transcript_22290:70-1371(+)